MKKKIVETTSFKKTVDSLMKKNQLTQENFSNFTMSNSKFYKDLKKSLEEAIAYKQGKLELRTTEIELLEPPAEYKPKQIKKIRESNHYSQSIFARILNVSTKTVQSWESGQRLPSHAALRLLEIVDKGIYRPQISRNTRK